MNAPAARASLQPDAAASPLAGSPPGSGSTADNAARCAWSLQNRLLVLLLSAALVAWSLGAVWLLQRGQDAADAMFDAALAETAHLVLALAAHESDERGAPSDVADELSELPLVPSAHPERMFFQVRDALGRIALVSPGAPTVPLANATERGYADHSIDGAVWRVLTQQDPRTQLVVHVGEPAASRAAFSRSALAQLAAPGLLLLAMLAAGTVFVTRGLLRPVKAAARQVAAAAPGAHLALDASSLPGEVAPLARAIEALQARVQRALLHERTLTADAAHELRTPLAALRAQAQWAQRATRDDERQQALAGVIAAADRCARLVDATLTLARLDASTFDAEALPSLDVARLVELVLADFVPTAAVRGIALQTHVDAGCQLRADADALAMLMRNLADNAIRHARSRVTLRVARDAGRVVVEVADDGEGVPAALRERLFDRFWRAPQGEGSRVATEGSGLGLALVRRVADLHHATIAVDDGLDGRGLGVRVSLPGAAVSADPT